MIVDSETITTLLQSSGPYLHYFVKGYKATGCLNIKLAIKPPKHTIADSNQYHIEYKCPISTKFY